MNHQPQSMTRNQEQNVVQGAVAAALAKATNEAAVKSNSNVAHILPANASNTATGIPMLVPRVDLLGTKILVLADSLDTEADTVKYYDLKKGSKPHTVSAAYYRSTKRLTEQSEIVKLANEFSKATGVKELIMRERLVKIGSSVERTEEGGVSANDLLEWKNKLISEITRVIMSM